MKRLLAALIVGVGLICTGQADSLTDRFASPPDSARPGVYWYFMDGNLSREGMTRDLESMKSAGIGHVLFLEVNVGVPRGPVGFLSEEWQKLYVHAVREAERLGIEITLGSGPGWTGSGGPWVRASESMQHLVASTVQVQGPGRFDSKLPAAPPRAPYFGDVPSQLKAEWESFCRDVAVLAFPTPTNEAKISDIDEKALYYREPFSSKPGVKPYLNAPAVFPTDPVGSAVPGDKVLDLTRSLQPDGSLDWQIPPGRWTVMRFVSRNNGASTRPSPEPGIGFECDKLDPGAFDAHYSNYVGKLLAKVGPRKPGTGWTMLHIDSWEMGAQNWTPKLREEFKRRRGYDPLPYYPAYLGLVVGSREQSERFLWDLRLTASELVVENHAEHMKELAHKQGFGLSIEPYDMNPSCDYDLGAVADVPMAEFWSIGFNTSYSVHQASSIAHVMGRPIVAAESFTGNPGEDWKFFPGSLKNQGDWALAAGVNKFVFHTFAHKPDESRPGMVMGPYGVHWDRGQTWWPMASAHHRYLSRCQEILRQGRTIADILYLMPEGAPNVFQPPASAFEGEAPLQDRRGYNFDGCSPKILMKLASVRDGRITFPSGAEYRVLVLPNFQTMTPELLAKVEGLVSAGATVIGPPPLKSPSLMNYPQCDLVVARQAELLWGKPSEDPKSRSYGKGKILSGGAFSATQKNALYPEYEPVAQALDQMGIPRDFASSGPIRYTHRRTDTREIYFVANRTDKPVQTEAAFRVTGRAPELWNPQTGAVRNLPQFSSSGGVTTVPLRFEPFESYFVVFPLKTEVVTQGRGNFAEAVPTITLEGAWDVTFDPATGGPGLIRFDRLEDWSTREDASVKYYSGIATYRKTFDLPAGTKASAGGRLWLDLGDVRVIARVRVNGTDCGVAWTAPWRVDITGAIRESANQLEIEVANLWPNRMIGDAKFPGKPFAQTTYHPYKASDPLLPSGLLGPVRVMTSDW